MKRNISKLMQAAAVSLTALIGPTGCSDAEMQTSDLVSGLDNAWEATEEPTEKYANKALGDLTDSPAAFGNEDYKAEWDDTFDTFTITRPLDQAQKAAMSLFLGDFGEDIYAFNDYARQMTDKDDVEKLIRNNFNDTWASVMIYLIAVNGSLDYVIETEDGDNDFEFDKDDMVKMLEEQGYFKSNNDSNN